MHVTARWSVLALLLVAGSAHADEPLLFLVGRGDTLGDILTRNADKIKKLLPEDSPLKTARPRELAQALIWNNASSLRHGLFPKNEVRVWSDGRLEVSAGAGEAPRLFLNRKQMDELAKTAPDILQEQLASLTQSGEVPMQPFEVGGDGRTLKVGAKTYTALGSLRFEARENHLHVSGDFGGRRFSVPVWALADLGFTFPPNPFFRETVDGHLVVKSGSDAGLGMLELEGQLRPHEDHYHLTSKFQHPSWQQLYAVSTAKDGDISASERQSAGAVLTRLLLEEVRLDPRSYARELGHLRTRIDRLQQAVNKDLPSAELRFVLRNNASIEEDGKIVNLDALKLSAAEGVYFGLCGKHVHVLGEKPARFDVAIEPPAKAGQALSVPKNVFVDLVDGVFVRKPLRPEVARLLEAEQLVSRHGELFLSQSYRHVAFDVIREALKDERIPKQKREIAVNALKAILETPLPVRTEGELLDALNRASVQIDRLEKKLPTLIPAAAQ